METFDANMNFEDINVYVGVPDEPFDMGRIFDPSNWFWLLDDGRVWSVGDAKFVTKKVAKDAGFDEIPVGPYDTAGKSSLDGLRQALDFYNLPKGELAS